MAGTPTRVDIHAHYFPTRYLELLTRFGNRQVGFVAGLGAGDGVGEMEARLGLMDEAGVDIQAVSLSSLAPHFEDAGRAIEAARLANALYAELPARWPDRFVALAALPLPDIDASLVELDRAMAVAGTVGVAVTTSVLGRSIADAAFEPLFAELDRRSTILFVHPAGRGAESPVIESAGLAWSIGAPIEDTVAATHLIGRGVPSRYPHLRIVIAHLGGALPMLLQRLDNQLPRAFPDLPEAPSVAARRMWYDTVAHGHLPALIAARDTFGADRLVLGTDFPYVRGAHYRASVDDIGRAGLDDGEVAAIVDRNGAVLVGGAEVSAARDRPPSPRRAG